MIAAEKRRKRRGEKTRTGSIGRSGDGVPKALHMLNLHLRPSQPPQRGVRWVFYRQVDGSYMDCMSVN